MFGQMISQAVTDAVQPLRLEIQELRNMLSRMEGDHSRVVGLIDTARAKGGFMVRQLLGE